MTDAAVKKVTVVLGAQRVKHYEASEFKNECSEYFERYYKILAMKTALPLPSVIPANFKSVVDTLSKWCESTAKRQNVKGFVLHSFLIKDLYLKIYNGELDGLSQQLNIENFPSTPTITVYNPNQRIIFLIRIAENEDIENEIKLCDAELKMLILLIGDELENTGIKVIPLVVTDKEITCMDCKSYLILREEIEDIDLFTSWCDQKSVKFDITLADRFEENKANKIFATVASCMGATKIHDKFPAFTAEEEKQMKGALLLLTPEQIDILHSENKHIIIQGPYGSGKSIIGRTKANMIADNLTESELLYYISYDSRSALLNEIQRSNPKIKIYPDKKGQKGAKLSDMIKDILRRNKMESQRDETNNKGQKKINMIIDEYDGEKLDRSEAHTLNRIINTDYKEIFQDAVILLIAQSMKKERRTKDNFADSNRFDLLEQMKTKTLTLVMRNSIQIHNLLEVTKEFLKNVRTRYELQEKSIFDFLLEKYEENNTKKQKKSRVTQQFTKSALGRLKDSETTLKSNVAQFAASDFELGEAIDYAGIQTTNDDDGSKMKNRFEYEQVKHIGYGLKKKIKTDLEQEKYDYQTKQENNTNKNEESTVTQQYTKSVLGRPKDSETTRRIPLAQFGSSSEKYDYQAKQENNTNKNEESMVMQQYTKYILGRLENSEITLKSSMVHVGTSNLELDEVFNYAGIKTANDDGGSKIENRFKYKKTTHKGHEVEKKKKIDLQQGKYDHQTKQKSNRNKNEEKTVTQQSVLGRLKDSERTLKNSVAQFGACNLELDEAFDYAGIPAANDDDGSKIENSFKYEKATHIGHGAGSKLPVLFELYQYQSEFQKILSLAAIFQNIQIESSSPNNNHVLLHFNVNNHIPSLAFKLFDLKHSTKVTTKVTNSYEEFKNESLKKYIFVGNFRTFRGLEHSRITIIIDRDIYSLQHYLVECIARCTTHLNVVLLGANKTINSITERWKEGDSGKPLIEIKKIIISNERTQSNDAYFQESEKIIIDTFSLEYKKLQQIFNRTSFQNNEGENLASPQEAKLAIEM